jgi:hypothetical protein
MAVTFLRTFSIKLNHLLDRLDNRRTPHGIRNDALEWTRRNQSDALVQKSKRRPLLLHRDASRTINISLVLRC